MSVRVRQVALVTVGALVALVMVVLGLWQAQVFVDKGNRSVEDRAAQAPVVLLDYVTADQRVGDVYGKQVVVTGTYVPGQELLIPTEGGVRVLSALQVPDGRVVPVVRGLAAGAAAVAPPPTGEVVQTGLFLPGEGDADAPTPSGQLGSVRMPLLAQLWPQQLVPGFVTLTAADAATYGLAEAPVTLPQGEGALQNAGYALQWWAFAIFGMVMVVKVAASLGDRERVAAAAAPLPRRRKGSAMDIARAAELIEPEDLPGIRKALLRYRIMAWVVGVLLVVLVVVGMPLKYLGDNDVVVVATGVPHGWLYMVLLITAYDLGRRVRWPWTRLLLIAAGGTVPFMSFVAEHYATKDVRARTAAVEASAPAVLADDRG